MRAFRSGIIAQVSTTDRPWWPRVLSSAKASVEFAVASSDAETGTGLTVLVCDPPEVIFGDSLRAAESTDPSEWIAESLRGQPGTVGALVPNLFESTLRLHAPDPTPDDWWELYRDSRRTLDAGRCSAPPTPTKWCASKRRTSKP